MNDAATLVSLFYQHRAAYGDDGLTDAQRLAAVRADMRRARQFIDSHDRPAELETDPAELQAAQAAADEDMARQRAEQEAEAAVAEAHRARYLEKLAAREAEAKAEAGEDA